MKPQQDNVEFTRPEVEDFLYLEAALLDKWRLREWLDLLTDDIDYHIPASDAPHGDGHTSLSLVYDNRERIQARVQQYLDNQVYAENPRSRLRRSISNVRILRQSSDGADIAANFVCYRFTAERMDTFVGHLEYRLVRRNGRIGIRRRRMILDLEALRPQGMLSFIL
ncbi:MAG: p-cumate 2,3-dioxygenase beta subunit [Candidatus Kentron sp. G]|nr:MAG: p-cumate 2,3-dioxygenase beta subunit [Candidatus Kentron sp. G]VFN02086.1 MAG: p-cumate 2,3-dioxygenase beta subunit [Candidatus Kentron sp. G]VFN03570.1 MAG: p-cumate 2,3-dioxygenase beta subunit [Candidatus Kentron sp. G]